MKLKNRMKAKVDVEHKETNANNINITSNNSEPSLFEIGMLLGEIKHDNVIIKRDIAALKKDFNYFKKGKK